jgi:hypothetical protein
VIEQAIEEFTRMLIKQDFKDKNEGIEYIKIPKVDLLKIIIRVLKYINVYFK